MDLGLCHRSRHRARAIRAQCLLTLLKNADADAVQMPGMLKLGGIGVAVGGAAVMIELAPSDNSTSAKVNSILFQMG